MPVCKFQHLVYFTGIAIKMWSEGTKPELPGFANRVFRLCILQTGQWREGLLGSE